MTRLPIPTAALDDRLGFIGTAGSGKTYGAGTCIERLIERKARAVISDPLGVWWGLRLLADGKTSSGFDVVIFGGPHGDLPLNEHAGALIGQTVASMTESAIVDLSELGAKASERRFMLAFLTALYKHASGEPVHLVFDEADMWAPQQMRDKEGESARLLGMMETVVRRGRVKGFIPWLISQRPAVINKDVLSQVDGFAAFKLTSSQDRDAIGDWVQGQADREQWKAIWASLPTLQRGEGVVWVPGRGVLETVTFPEKLTFDSSRTPKRGEKKRTTELKPLDVAGLRAKLASVEQEAKANDPKALRAEISRLQRELRAKPEAAADPKAIEAAERRSYDAGARDEWKLGSSAVRTEIEAISQETSGIDRRLKALVAAIEKISAEMPAPARPLPHAEPNVPRQMPERAKPVPYSGNGPDTQFTPTTRKILDVIHRSYPVSLSFQAAAARAGVSRRSSAYGRYRREIETSGEVEQRSDGRFKSNPSFSAPVGPGTDPIQEFSARLPPSYAAMLRVIAGAGGRQLHRDFITEMASVSAKSSGIVAGLKELTELGLVERDGDRYALHPDLCGGAPV